VTNHRDNVQTSSIVDLAARVTELVNSIHPGLLIPKGEPIANFQVKVQEQGRIQVPGTQRELAGITKGDIVQVILWRIKAVERDSRSGPK